MYRKTSIKNEQNVTQCNSHCLSTILLFGDRSSDELAGDVDLRFDAILTGSGSPELIRNGKFNKAREPRIRYAALSYATAASSAVSNVPNHTRAPFFAGSRISAANLPHGLLLTPL
ncbi:hypothetical protein Hanom_Chr04g00312991 [Helianthus anomalus]